MKRYRKKPLVITAVKWDGENYLEVNKLGGISTFVVQPNNGTILINTLEGRIVALKGDYIIKGIAGELYPCKAKIFEASYEEVND